MMRIVRFIQKWKAPLLEPPTFLYVLVLSLRQMNSILEFLEPKALRMSKVCYAHDKNCGRRLYYFFIVISITTLMIGPAASAAKAKK